MSDQPTVPEDDLNDPLTGIEIPDDLSALEGSGAGPAFVLVITQIAGAEPLAAACALADVDADALATDIGAVAVLRETAVDSVTKAANALTTLIAGVPIIVVERRADHLTITRWQDGVRGDELAPGLVLGGAPEEVEDLVTGATQVDQLPNIVASTSITRWKAMRLLTSAARKARKK